MTSGRVDGKFWLKTACLIENYKKEKRKLINEEKWIMKNKYVGSIAFDMSYEEIQLLFKKDDIINLHDIGNGYKWLTGWYELFSERTLDKNIKKANCRINGIIGSALSHREAMTEEEIYNLLNIKLRRRDIVGFVFHREFEKFVYSKSIEKICKKQIFCKKVLKYIG